MTMTNDSPIVCRTTPKQTSRVRIGHGSGGRMSADLIDKVFLPHLAPSGDGRGDDAAIVRVGEEQIAITTDSYVVQPIEFPGGNIGTLAINGTINDLAMRGAVPTHITAAFILEEGLELDELARIVEAMGRACRHHGVEFAAGDTKVVNKGAGDKLFITTTGIGRVAIENPPSCKRVQPGDVVIVSGGLGRHGTAVMCTRESLKLNTQVESDCAALHGLVEEMLATGADVHCLRDVTRGGLATVLNEIAAASHVTMHVKERDIPVDKEVRAVCELLGLDPLYVACEGRLVAFVSADESENILAAMRTHELGRDAAIIGRAGEAKDHHVILESAIGGRRILDKLSGEQLPRIC